MKQIVDQFHPVMGAIPFCGDTFFPSGGEDTIADALRDAGWRLRFREGGYWHEAGHPETGAVCTYVEGDLYEGSQISWGLTLVTFSRCDMAKQKGSVCPMRGNQDVDKDVVEFVRLGFHNNVSLDFKVQVRNRATFDEVIKAAAAYFDPRRIAETIGPVFDDAWSVEFGREFRPVLYIVIPSFPSQRLGAPSGDLSEPYTDEQRRDLARRVIEWAQSVDAEEITVQQHPITDEPVWNEPGENPYMVRIWWD